MGDWIIDNSGWCLIIIITVMVILCGISAGNSSRLIEQCLADGKKEYECHAMLDSHTNVIPAPIIIGR